MYWTSCGSRSSCCCRCTRPVGRGRSRCRTGQSCWGSVPTLHRHRVGRSAARVEVRFGHDLLATAAGLAGSQVFDRLHELLLAELNAAAAIGSHTCVYASHVRAKKKGSRHQSEPDRPGQDRLKHHLFYDGGGIPLAATLIGGTAATSPNSSH